MRRGDRPPWGKALAALSAALCALVAALFNEPVLIVAWLIVAAAVAAAITLVENP